MAFNPQDHMSKLGNREYLEVKWRIAWYRDVHPKGQIRTTFLAMGEILIAQTDVTDNEGNFLASGSSTVRTGTGRETWAGREIEKAETAAIGRALAHAGFGTQFTEDDESDNLTDSPVQRSQQKKDPLDPDTHGLSKDIPQRFKTKPITEIEVRQDEKGEKKPYIVAAGLTLFSRAPFRELEYHKGFTEGELKTGKFAFSQQDAFEIVWQRDGNKKVPVKMIRVSNGKEAEIK